MNNSSFQVDVFDPEIDSVSLEYATNLDTSKFTRTVNVTVVVLRLFISSKDNGWKPGDQSDEITKHVQSEAHQPQAKYLQWQ